MKQKRWSKFPTYLAFLAMMVAACGLIYLALAQLPRQKYILQSIFEEQAKRLLAEKMQALEQQIAQQEEQIMFSLNPVDRTSFAIKPGWAAIAFWLDAQFNIVLPAIVANYPKWKGEDADVSSKETAGRFFLEGQQYEFSLRQYDQAVKFYTLAIEQSLYPGLEIKIRLALAASLFKLKRYDQAAEQAQKAALDAKGKAVNPYFELTGWYWYAMALLSLNNPQATTVLLDLYQRILKRDFFLPRKSQYLFWENKLSELLQGKQLGDAEKKVFAALQSQRRFLIEAEGLCSFWETQGIENIKKRLPPNTNDICHYYAPNVEKPYLIAYQALKRDEKFYGVRGFSINLDHCRQAFSNILAPTENFTFTLRSPSESPPNDAHLEGSPFIAALPLKAWAGFQLAVGQKSPDELEKMILREKIFTLLITGLIAVVLFAGLYFTWKNLLREVELSRLKSDFVDCISHELRTPLALIQSYTETLVLGRVGEDKKNHYYKTIMREIERLTRLITNILNVSQIEAGKFHIVREEISLSSLLNKFVEEKAIYWPSYRGLLTLEISDLPALVLLDGAAIRSAIFNLLDNAIQYGPQDQGIVIGCRCGRAELCFWVEDHGKGIALEEQKKILQKFYRGRSSKGTRGIGLGFKIVCHVVKAHGGNVYLKSVLGKGTLVELRIPLHIPEGATDESENSSSGR